MLIDNKQTSTNGFDVIENETGEIVVSGVRKNGPADGKLEEGE